MEKTLDKIAEQSVTKEAVQTVVASRKTLKQRALNKLKEKAVSVNKTRSQIEGNLKLLSKRMFHLRNGVILNGCASAVSWGAEIFMTTHGMPAGSGPVFIVALSSLPALYFNFDRFRKVNNMIKGITDGQKIASA